MLAASPPPLGRLWSYVPFARLRRRAARARQRAPRAAYLTPSHGAARTSKAIQLVLNVVVLPRHVQARSGRPQGRSPSRRPAGGLAEAGRSLRQRRRARDTPLRSILTSCPHTAGLIARLLQPLLCQLGRLAELLARPAAARGRAAARLDLALRPLAARLAGVCVGIGWVKLGLWG